MYKRQDQIDAHIHTVARNWQQAELSEADKALCSFADKLTDTPGQMSEADVKTLRTSGFNDVAIHDAAQVIGYFNYINRVADALDVDLEDFVEPW